MYYENKLFENIKLNGQVLNDMEFTECEFRECSFENCQINRCSFHSCIFSHCGIISLRSKDSQIRFAEFSKCNLIGVHWNELIIKRAVFEPIKKMTNCFLKYNTFMDINFTRFDFSGSSIQESVFDECVLKESVFKGCRLEGTQYLNCDLQKADFRETSGYQIDITANKLKGAKFSFPDVINLLNSLEITID